MKLNIQYDISRGVLLISLSYASTSLFSLPSYIMPETETGSLDLYTSMNVLYIINYTNMIITSHLRGFGLAPGVGPFGGAHKPTGC